jgi:hypothetical protein
MKSLLRKTFRLQKWSLVEEDTLAELVRQHGKNYDIIQKVITGQSRQSIAEKLGDWKRKLTGKYRKRCPKALTHEQSELLTILNERSNKSKAI